MPSTWKKALERRGVVAALFALTVLAACNKGQSSPGSSAGNEAAIDAEEAQSIAEEARRIKTPQELRAMRDAIGACEAGVAVMVDSLEPAHGRGFRFQFQNGPILFGEPPHQIFGQVRPCFPYKAIGELTGAQPVYLRLIEA